MSSAQIILFPATSTVESQKENTPLKQTTLLSALDKGLTNGRKRTITLVNGDEVDLTASVPVTPEVLDAMRLRIIQLEDELATPPPAKRAKTAASTSANAVASTSIAPVPTASSSKAEEKKRKVQVKKIFGRLKKECKSDSLKFQGSPKTIKFDEVLEQSEFETLLGGKGVLVQPTPQNKPKSTVTIIEFNTAAHIQGFFGDELKPLKGNHWSKGGVPTRSFGFFGGGGGGGFSKSVKHGPCDVSIRSAEISYSKNGMKCTLKFEVEQVGGGGGGYDSDW
ncbi:hypothetical protein DFH08DRAFT_921150 [Mycena albidolilacea]|uniref:Uncharacterized protein n=1 Tax=Mycena albidolilacea TaxID=1033008 RepID=A0AAD7F316_9AGAR|nr:hypothetical protein DFH08DRAFT_921150 [Mycena albidolilacea]